jgi:hypothetical protein
MAKRESNDLKDYPSLGLLYPSDYLCGDDLRGSEWTVIIDHIEPRHELKKAGSKKSEYRPMVRLKTTKGRAISKKWVMNKTNAKRIAKLHGPEVLNWIGKPIILGTEMVNAFGADHNAIRVAERMPPAQHTDNEAGSRPDSDEKPF